MRVLHIVDHSIPLQSGYTFRSRAIFQEQRALGLETFHLSGPKHALTANTNPPQEVVDGLEFYRTSPDTGPTSKLLGFNQWSVVRALEKRLKEVITLVKPDILHAHSPALNGQAMLNVGRKFDLPTVYEIRGFWEDAAVSHGTSHENGLKYRLSRWLEERVFRNADGVVCICDGIRKDLVARGVASDRIIIVPNAVDTRRFQPLPMRDPELDSSLALTGKSVIGFVGSFYYYEGLMLLLEALPAILAVRPDVRLLLVGGGQDARPLRERAAALGLDDKVVFTGRVANDIVDRYYSLIDILCYPRLPMRLTELVTPLKPLEAMAQQKPLVASDVGGHRELVRDGETGILFKAGDAKDLANKLTQLLDTPSLQSRLGNTGRRFVEEERTWANSVAHYLPLYERLAGPLK